MSLTAEITKIATIDLFKKDPVSGLVDTGPLLWAVHSTSIIRQPFC